MLTFVTMCFPGRAVSSPTVLKFKERAGISLGIANVIQGLHGLALVHLRLRLSNTKLEL
jgi:hypothetical protein